MTGDTPLFAVFRTLYRWRILILSTGVLFALGAALFSLTLSPAYTATAILFPAKQSEAAGGLSSLMGMGGRFGIGGMGMGQQDPTDLLTDFAKTNTFLNRILGKKFRSENKGEWVTLKDLYPIRAARPELKKYYLLQSLQKTIAFEPIKRSGLLIVKVSAPEAVLARDLTDTVIQELNAYYKEILSLKKRSYREFLEQRLQEAETTLGQSEEQLRQFREHNRNPDNSEALGLRQARLLREVRINEELYLTLKKEYEVARLDEQKDRPAVEILDAPEIPLFKSAPQRRKFATFFGFIGLLVGVALAVLVENRAALSWFFRELRSPGSKNTA